MLKNNRVPVNKMAAMVTARAPWWAQPLPEKPIKKVKTSLRVEEIISVTNPPPIHIRNRIGLVFNDLTIIGYADSTDGRFNGHKSSGCKKPKTWIGDGYDHKKASAGWKKTRFWWVIRTDGEVFRAKYDTLKKIKIGLFRGNIDCRGCFFDSTVGRCLNTDITKQSNIGIDGKPICFKDK